MILQEGGFLTISACGAQEAMALSGMPTQRIDMLVSEVRLGDGHGLDLASRIRSARADVAVLMISGSPEYREEADTSEYAFLAKPFLPQQLLAAVDRVMARRRLAAG
jgi:DNA-binding NtrC family response regulator